MVSSGSNKFLFRLLLMAAILGALGSGAHVSVSKGSEPISYARIKADIQRHSIGSVDELLKYFAKHEDYASLLTNPVLNETSFAIHGDDVTPDFPRIVLHNDQLVMMMVGNPAKESGQILEMIEFLPNLKKFKFRMINFLAKATGEQFIDNPEFVDFAHEFKHPSFHKGVFECAGCHGYPPSLVEHHPEFNYADPRPRWNTPPFWQTPYGQTNDMIANGSRQYINWQAFQKTVADPKAGSRYRLLKIRTESDARGNILFVDRPNATLTRQLYRLNLARVANIIETSPRYSELRYAVAGAFFGCDTSRFFPQTWEADQEKLIKSVLNFNSRIYQSQSVPRSTLKPGALENYARTHGITPGDTPEEVMLDDGAYLSMTTLPIRQALRVLIEATDHRNLHSVLDHSGQSKFATDLRGFNYNGTDFSLMTVDQVARGFVSPDDAYYPVLAELRFLLEDSVRQVPLYWSAGVSYIFDFSYRFADGNGGLANLLTDYLGPNLMETDPDLDKFSDHRVDPAKLTVPVAAYCDLLAAKSKMQSEASGD